MTCCCFEALCLIFLLLLLCAFVLIDFVLRVLSSIIDKHIVGGLSAPRALFQLDAAKH